jgi:hypothetical protein
MPALYRGCPKNVPIAGRFFRQHAAAILFMEHNDGKRYNQNLTSFSRNENHGSDRSGQESPEGVK